MTVENSFNQENEKLEIEILAARLVLISVVGYQTGVDSDRVIDDCVKVLTAFLETRYQRKN